MFRIRSDTTCHKIAVISAFAANSVCYGEISAKVPKITEPKEREA